MGIGQAADTIPAVYSPGAVNWNANESIRGDVFRAGQGRGYRSKLAER